MQSRAIVKKYVDIAFRRRWWLIVPVVLFGMGSGALVLALPKVYRASTTILVTPQRLPEDFVRSTVTVRVEERIQSLGVQILSRRYLEQVGKEFGLIPTSATEEAVEQMYRVLRGQISLDYDRRGLSWFRIVVQDRSPKLAAGIANRLAGLFIEQNTLMRSEQATGTLETIQTWLDRAKGDLEAREAKLAAYRSTHMWELPDQEGANIQLLQSAQQRITQLTTDIQIRSERLAALRVELQARRAIDAATGQSSSDSPDARALAALEQELRQLLASYTEENPLVRRKRAEIEEFKAQHPDLGTGGSGGASRQPLSEDARLQAEIDGLEREREREIQTVATLRQRIANIPLRQQELASLTRDYETLRREYEDTLSKREQARRAQDLEASKQGEQFQIQDPAQPPAMPAKPQPALYLAIGLILGLGVGVGATALLEFLDSSIRSEEELKQAFPRLVVLGSVLNLDARVPLARERGRRERRRGTDSGPRAVAG